MSNWYYAVAACVFLVSVWLLKLRCKKDQRRIRNLTTLVVTPNVTETVWQENTAASRPRTNAVVEALPCVPPLPSPTH